MWRWQMIALSHLSLCDVRIIGHRSVGSFVYCTAIQPHSHCSIFAFYRIVSLYCFAITVSLFSLSKRLYSVLIKLL